MYADPTHIRDNVIKVRLNDPEYDVFMAMARLNERQPAVFLRELAFFALALAEKSNGQSSAA